MTSDERLQRTWQRIAEEATQETDPQKILKLTYELTRVIIERKPPVDDKKDGT